MRDLDRELDRLQRTLRRLREEGKVRIALLYGSFAHGVPHARSDIDLAVYLNASIPDEAFLIVDEILMSTDRDVSLLRLDDDDESPLVVQEALKGVHMVDPDTDTLYELSRRVLHECEGMRFRREKKIGQG